MSIASAVDVRYLSADYWQIQLLLVASVSLMCMTATDIRLSADPPTLKLATYYIIVGRKLAWLIISPNLPISVERAWGEGRKLLPDSFGHGLSPRGRKDRSASLPRHLGAVLCVDSVK